MRNKKLYKRLVALILAGCVVVGVLPSALQLTQRKLRRG